MSFVVVFGATFLWKWFVFLVHIFTIFFQKHDKQNKIKKEVYAGVADYNKQLLYNSNEMRKQINLDIHMCSFPYSEIKDKNRPNTMSATLAIHSYSDNNKESDKIVTIPMKQVMPRKNTNDNILSFVTEYHVTDEVDVFHERNRSLISIKLRNDKAFHLGLCLGMSATFFFLFFLLFFL